MADKVLRKGYIVEIASWENDGDMNATHTHSFMDLESAKEAVAITKLLTRNSPFRNMYSPRPEVLKALAECIINETDMSWYDWTPDPDNPDEMIDFAMERLYDLNLNGMEDEQVTRHVESIHVYHIPEDITLKEIQL